MILDAFAVIALLRGEPAATEVQTLLANHDCAVATLGVAEVLDQFVRVDGWTPDDVVVDLADLGLLPALDLDTSAAVQAAMLRSQHYHRRTRTVSLADCVAAHAARATGSALATADPHLLDLCHDEDIDVIALPDSRGHVWAPR